MTQRVYVHVGLPKTGTTFLQWTLWGSKQELAADGVLLPGTDRRFQRFAAWDLLGRRLRGVNQTEVPGTWGQVVRLTRDWSGRAALISDEFLVHARTRDMRRIVADLSPAQVHVIVTVRDLARVIGSAWQQEILKGHTWRFEEFLAAVRDPEQGPPTAGVAFWLRYDLPRILQGWAEVLPPDRIHVVLVPPQGASAHGLLERFASVLDVPVDRLTPTREHLVNASLGMTATEVLRRANQHLEGQPLNERAYRHVVDKVVTPVLRELTGGGQIPLPPSELDWVTRWTDDVIRRLQERPYHVVGDLDDLRPRAVAAEPSGAPGREATTSPGTEEQLLDATVRTLAAVMVRHGRLWWRTRDRAAQTSATPLARLASAQRAARYRAKVRALEYADGSRLVGFLARGYTRRVSRGRPARQR